MRQPDSPDPFGATAGGSERPDPVATRALDLDPGPILRFAQELGRLLGQHLARAGFPPEDPEAARAVPTRPRSRPAP
jgi:hypothetical protein